MPIGGDWSSVFKLRVTKERKQCPDKESNMVGESMNKSRWLGSASWTCSCRGMCAGIEIMTCICSQCDAKGQGTAQSSVLARGDEALVPKGLLATSLLSLLAQKPAASGNPGDSGVCPGSLLPQLTAGPVGAHAPLS